MVKYVVLWVFFYQSIQLITSSDSYAQFVDPIAQARSAMNSVKIAKNSVSIAKNGMGVTNNRQKTVENKQNINRLKQTVKSELKKVNKKLEKGNEKLEKGNELSEKRNKLSTDLNEDFKKYHEETNEEIEKKRTVNTKIMTLGILENIRNSHNKINKLKRSGLKTLSNTPDEQLPNEQKKMMKTGFEAIADDAKRVYDEYKLVKTNDQLQMTDGERLVALKDIRKQMNHNLELMLYWKNKTDYALKVQHVQSREIQSFEQLLGK